MEPLDISAFTVESFRLWGMTRNAPFWRSGWREMERYGSTAMCRRIPGINSERATIRILISAGISADAIKNMWC